MKIFENFDLRPMNVIKIVGLMLVVFIVLIFGIRVIGSFSDLPSPNFSMDRMSESYSPVASQSKMSGGMSNLSIRNVAQDSDMINNKNMVGDNAEEMEVTEYNAIIETRHMKEDCAKVLALKARVDVIFENANDYERGCDYSFKVKRLATPEILNIIKELDPRDLNENTQTIKKLVDDYTSETDILEKKMKSVESTLSDAVLAYDEIASVATKTRDAESLTKIISSKIGVIERLTQQRIDINSQLERLKRAKAEQLDRLDYTYFGVHISEDKFIDQQELKDSWKSAVKGFFSDINNIAQNITINLVSILFLAISYIIYFFLLLVIAKYVWRWAKSIWMK